ncbi:MAG: phosphodiester glycosidase family protein [Micromonosporaceae bacterium]|nr:phosphodiester glycosidase family protein [Micromonosporaceae bacterium]
MNPTRILAVALTATLVAMGAAAPAAAQGDALRLAPGVTLSSFSVPGATGELITVDLTQPHLRVDLLHPGVVGARERISSMVDRQGAVIGVNGDFFNITESQHPGVPPTNSSNGPEVTEFRALKAAVPNSQRFGPAMAPGTSTRDVIGIDASGRARIGTLTLVGTVTTRDDHYPLAGLNQYALPQNSIGLFTSDWGEVSRQRAVCGSDTRRADPCTSDAAEVLVRHGRVVAVSDTPGAGAIARDELVLVGREAGAADLRKLTVGDPVSVHYRLTGEGIPFRFAVGAAPILRDGAVMPGVDAKTAATRTAAGISADGRRLYLVTLDGDAESGAGLTLAQLAELLAGFGAADGVNLDGGGSTTCAVRLPGSVDVTLCNHLPSGGAERPVANGIGVFVRHW